MTVFGDSKLCGVFLNSPYESILDLLLIISRIQSMQAIHNYYFLLQIYRYARTST